MRFLINGTRCELKVNTETIEWSSSENRRQVPFDHVIGFRMKGSGQRHGVAARAARCCRNKRIKIYYSKLKGNQARLKWLTIHESTPNTESGPLQPHQQPQAQQQQQPQSQQQLDHDQALSLESQISPSSLAQLAKLIEAGLERERRHRPRRLLVFVNPFGGKGKAPNLFHGEVSRLLALANVESRLVITERANHARETLEDPRFNVYQFDGIICVGGDGMFSELMNGLLFRYNRAKIARHLERTEQLSARPFGSSGASSPAPSSTSSEQLNQEHSHDTNNSITPKQIVSNHQNNDNDSDKKQQQQQVHSNDTRLARLRSSLGGIGLPFDSPPIPIGVIGAGSTDANSFGLIGTNDVTTATLNIILGNQITIDVCSVHSADVQDTPLRFVSTFAAYGYFGDVIRESERFRWLGPSRYDLTGFNNLLKNRSYPGLVRALVRDQDGTPYDEQRCHSGCEKCLGKPDQRPDTEEVNKITNSDHDKGFRFVEHRGLFVGVNAAVTACRCHKSKKGFAPNNHLANGCADLILVKPCSRIQYLKYLLRTGYSKMSAFDLSYVDAYRCRQFEFEALDLENDTAQSTGSTATASSTYSTDSIASNKSPLSSWNLDGEMLDRQSIRVKVNNRLLKVFGRGEALV